MTKRETSRRTQSHPASFICTIVALFAGVILTNTALAWQGMPTPPLHVNGRYLQDPTGKNVVLVGYMQPGDSYFNGGHGVNFHNPNDYTSPANVASALNFFKDVATFLTTTTPLFGRDHGWYNSFVRFAGSGTSTGGAPGWDASGNLSNIAQFHGWIENVIVPYVEHCKSVGLYVVITGNPTFVPADGDGQRNMTYQHQQNLITYWQTVAGWPGIKNADNVMFEIVNEPVAIETSFGAGDWGQGSDPYHRAITNFMQPIADAIRETGAENVVWIPGLVWQGQYNNFATYPVQGLNIGYAAHIYPFGASLNDPVVFNNLWNGAFKACADLYPMIFTECAWHPDDPYDLIDGTTEGFGINFKNACDASGNISLFCGMTGDVIGGLPQRRMDYPTKASGQAGFEWWPTYTWAAPSGPPMGLSATIVVDGQVNLVWSAATDATGYNIKRSTSPGGPYSVVAANITTTSFCDTSVAPDQTYYYVVSANTPRGESDDSNEVNPSVVYAYLRFDETGGTTAYDATGNGWNGTLVNGPIWSEGKFSNGVSLDGSNDYVSLPAGVVNDLTDVTIATWVYLNSIGNWSRVFDFGTGQTVNMFLTPRSGQNGAVRFAITTSGANGEQRITGTAALPTGAWTHVAVTISDGTGILYVNGAEVGRNNAMSLTPGVLGNTTQNYIGRSQYPDPYLNGRVDEFRIYANALNAADIRLLFREEIPAAAPSMPMDLTVTGIADGRIDLVWEASAATTNYNIKRSAFAGGPYTLIASVSETSFSDTELPEKTAFYYVVSAVNSVGQSADSAQISATTPALPPAAPSGLMAAAGDGSVTLNWVANTESDLAGYNVYRSTTPGSGYVRLNSDLLLSSGFTDNTPAYYTTYYYVVSAVDTDATESSFSDTAKAVPFDGRAVVLSSTDFEEGFGDWVNLSGDDFHDWIRHSGTTPIPMTGPSGGADGSTWYAFFRTSHGYANRAGDTAILQSPVIDGFDRILTFHYHMYGAHIGTLSVDVYDGVWHESVWILSGPQHAAGDAFSQALVDLRGFTGPITIRLRAVAVGGGFGDIAIDEIDVSGRYFYGDINGDGIVDIDDLADFAGYWLQENCELDLSGDCQVGLYEFAEFAKDWLEESPQ